MIEALLVATLAAPAIFLAACCVATWRPRALSWQFLAPAPGLAAGVFGLSHPPVSVDFPGLGLSLTLDPPGALLLAFAALLWMGVTAALWRDRAPDARLGVSWLLTMIGSLGVFVAADLVSFYLVYALVSLPAYGLIAFSDDPEKRGPAQSTWPSRSPARRCCCWLSPFSRPASRKAAHGSSTSWPPCRASPWRDVVVAAGRRGVWHENGPSSLSTAGCRSLMRPRRSRPPPCSAAPA